MSWKFQQVAMIFKEKIMKIAKFLNLHIQLLQFIINFCSAMKKLHHENFSFSFACHNFYIFLKRCAGWIKKSEIYVFQLASWNVSGECWVCHLRAIKKFVVAVFWEEKRLSKTRIFLLLLRFFSTQKSIAEDFREKRKILHSRNN